MIQRNYYLDRLIRNMWNGEIKVITGIRRCGKSVLLFELFDEYLRNHGTDATQIIKIELDQRRYYKYRNPITLCEYVEQLVLGQQDKKLYLFIDEVQLTAKVIDQENGGIEVTIYDMLNELKAYKNLDVYVTGSNSKGLSKDIATEFRGRATQIHVFPLCFEEFYSAVGGDERKALDTYMLYGGMPRLLAMQDDKDKKDFRSSLASASGARCAGKSLCGQGNSSAKTLPLRSPRMGCSVVSLYKYCFSYFNSVFFTRTEREV